MYIRCSQFIVRAEDYCEKNRNDPLYNIFWKRKSFNSVKWKLKLSDWIVPRAKVAGPKCFSFILWARCFFVSHFILFFIKYFFILYSFLIRKGHERCFIFITVVNFGWIKKKKKKKTTVTFFYIYIIIHICVYFCFGSFI